MTRAYPYEHSNSSFFHRWTPKWQNLCFSHSALVCSSTECHECVGAKTGNGHTALLRSVLNVPFVGRSLHIRHPGKIHSVFQNGARQESRHVNDCGVFVLFYARCLLQGELPTWTPDTALLRAQIAREIANEVLEPITEEEVSPSLFFGHFCSVSIHLFYFAVATLNQSSKGRLGLLTILGTSPDSLPYDSNRYLFIFFTLYRSGLFQVREVGEKSGKWKVFREVREKSRKSGKFLN